MSKFTIPRRNNYQVRDPVLEDRVLDKSKWGWINSNNVYRALQRIKGRYHQLSSNYKEKGRNASYKANTTQKNWIETLINDFKNQNQINNSKNIKTMCKFNKFNGIVTNFFNNIYPELFIEIKKEAEFLV